MKTLNLIFAFSLVTLLSACGGGAQTQPSDEEATAITPEGQVDENTIDKGNAPQEKAPVEVIGAVDEAAQNSALEAQTLTAEEIRKQQEMDAKTFRPVVYFGYDQSAIDEQNMATIMHYAEYLNQNLAEKITLTGHTDARGTPEYNLALGEKRAKSVREIFMLYGVNESRISLVTMGEEMPVIDEQTEEAWAQNRRVEFSISQ